PRLGVDASDDGDAGAGDQVRGRRSGRGHPRPCGCGALRSPDRHPRRPHRGGGMRQLLGIARSLLRGGGRRTLLDLALTVFGVAIPVAVTFLVLGTIAGFSDRENRTAWREPTEASTEEATALQRLVYHPWQGKRVDVVELREIAPGTPPPPGMDRMPVPGEIWVSPALADALGGDTPRFEERLGGEIAGVLGAPALAHEADLVRSSATRPWSHRGNDCRSTIA